jgi:hypothetical protein
MVFQCECCHYSTPFKYALKQHLLTKKHLSKFKDVPDELSILKLKIEEQEKLIDNQTSQIDDMNNRLRLVGSNMGNTTNNNVQHIHILLHPDMHLTKLTNYDYQVILKKIQERDFSKMERLDLGIGE